MSHIDTPRPAAFHRRFRRCDLNLLVTLDALFAEDGNVTRTADRLAISQSATSHALSRLREVFRDELFVRAGPRMVPTAFAMQLKPMIYEWIEGAERVLITAQPFDLRHAHARLVVSVPEQIERMVMPPLMEHLFDVAPDIEIFVTPLPLGETLDALDAGQIDLAIAIGDVDFKPWHVAVLACETSFVQVYDPRLIMGERPLKLECIALLPHLKVSYEPARNIVVDGYFERHGLARRIAAGCAGAASVARMVAARPLVAILPALVARSFPQGVQLAVEPFGDDSLSLRVYIVWHRRSDRDEAHAYVRRCLARYLDDDYVQG